MKFIRLYILLLVLFCLFLYGCAKPATSNSAAPFSSATDISSTGSTVTTVVSQISSASASSTVASLPSVVVPSSEQIKPVEKTVTLTIDSSKAAGGRTLKYINTAIQDNETVYSVLTRVCKQKDIKISSKISPSAYVEAIDGISEFDNGALSGWIYCVNGQFPITSCDKYNLKDGDQIKFIYTLDSGKTEEKK